MSRIPRALARRIDRLAQHAHRFHRLSHHPLCAEYSGELVSLGRRTRICRGCSFALLGALSGVLLGSLSPVPSPAVLGGLWAGAIAGGAAQTFRRSKGRRLRWPKALSRFLPVLAVVYAVIGAWRTGPLGLALSGTTAIMAFASMTAYRRQGPDRAPCVTCPERDRAEPCRGVLPIVRRERAFRRLAGQWMARRS